MTYTPSQLNAIGKFFAQVAERASKVATVNQLVEFIETVPTWKGHGEWNGLPPSIRDYTTFQKDADAITQAFSALLVYAHAYKMNPYGRFSVPSMPGANRKLTNSDVASFALIASAGLALVCQALGTGGVVSHPGSTVAAGTHIATKAATAPTGPAAAQALMNAGQSALKGFESGGVQGALNAVGPAVTGQLGQVAGQVGQAALAGIQQGGIGGALSGVGNALANMFGEGDAGTCSDLTQDAVGLQAVLQWATDSWTAILSQAPNGSDAMLAAANTVTANLGNYPGVPAWLLTADVNAIAGCDRLSQAVWTLVSMGMQQTASLSQFVTVFAQLFFIVVQGGLCFKPAGTVPTAATVTSPAALPPATATPAAPAAPAAPASMGADPRRIHDARAWQIANMVASPNPQVNLPAITVVEQIKTAGARGHAPSKKLYHEIKGVLPKFNVHPSRI